MGGAGCRHAVRNRVAVRVCSLYDRRIAVSFAVRSAENRGTRAAELTAAPDEKRYIRGKRCHAWQRFFLGVFAVTREIPLRDGGFVNLTTGVCYYRPETGRLWNRTALEPGSSEPNNSGTAAD